MTASRRRLLANLIGLTAVACSNLFMGGPATGGGGAQPVPEADPSEVLLGVGLTILSQLIGESALSLLPADACVMGADLPPCRQCCLSPAVMLLGLSIMLLGMPSASGSSTYRT